MQRMKGQNCIQKYKGIAERLVSRIVEKSEVAGIVFAGGLARGFTDRYSDVDVIVFLRKKNDFLRDRILEIGVDEQRRSGVDVDLEIHLLDDFRKRRLSEIQKWDFSHVQIAFDPSGETRQLLREKTRVTRNFWIRRIAVCSEYIKWYCCSPSADIGTIAESWVERGDLLSAHYCADYCLDSIFDVVYALNKEFVPPPKWKIFYLHYLAWLPNDFRRLLRVASLSRTLSAKDLGRRIGALRALWQEILPKIETETGLTSASMSKYFVENVLRQA